MTFDVEKLKLSRPSKKDTQKSNKAETERYKKEQEEKRKAEYEKYKAGLKALEENREDFIENNEKRQNAPVRAMTHNVLANGPQTLVMNNLAKTYQEQQKAENKKAAEDKIFSGYSLDRQKSTIENLQKQLDYAKDYDAKKKKGVTSEKGTLKRDETGRVVTESGVDSDYIADLEAKIKRYSDLYYANKNETQLSQMEKLPEQKAQYEAASQTDADNEVLRRVLDKVNTGNFEWDEDYEYVAEKFGITTDNKSMEQYRDELMAALDEGKQFVSDTATQLKKLDFDYEGLENYKAMLKAQEEYDAQVERAQQNYEERPLLSNLQTVANAPGMAVEAIAKGIKSIGHNDPTDFENYRPMNKYNMPVTTYVQAVRQSTDEDIDSEVLSFLYNTGMSVADSTVLALTFGPAATVAMGGASAASYMQEAVDRGLSNKQILTGAIATGAAEALAEYTPIDKLLNGAMNAATVKELLKAIGVQAATEGIEEMLTEGANILSDAIITGRNSKNAHLVKQYMADGMTKEEAEKKVFWDNVKNVLLAGLGGAISGGVSAGGFGAVNVIGEKMSQRNMPKFDAQTQTRLENAYEIYASSTSEPIAFENYAKEFEIAYEYGKGEVGKEYAMQKRHTPHMSDAQLENAYDAGVIARLKEQGKNNVESEDAQSYNMEENNGEKVHLREVSNGSYGENTGGQIRQLEESAGRNQSGLEKSRPADSETAALTYGEKVSEASLGIEGGSKNAHIRIVKSGETKAIKNAKAQAKSRGLELVLFGGDNLQISQKGEDGKTYDINARAFIVGNKVYARVDHPDFTTEQLVKHEIGHDMIDKGEINPNVVRERIDKEFTKARADAIVDKYIEAYEGSGMSPEEIWKEIVCDSLADMNEFSKTKYRQITEGLQLAVKRTVGETKTESTRGPPANSKTSVEVLPDGKKYVRADRQVIFGNDPDSWSEQLETYINNKIRKGENVTLIAVDGDLLTLTEDTAGKISSPYKDGGRISDGDFERKVSAGAHIDELAMVSTRGKKDVKDVEARHGETAKDGWNYRTAFFLDFDGTYYRCTISVSKGKNGNAVYNIGEMKKRSFPTVQKALSGSSANGGAQRGKTSSEVKIAHNGSSVKGKASREIATDSDGGKLSKGQQEYFKDSKERDNSGHLRVMYRGGNEDFTVFDRKKSKYSNLYGKGFYFTNSKSHAEQYGKATAFYLNITSPVSTSETTITRAQMHKFLKAVAGNEDDYSFENYGYGATVDGVLRDVYSGKSDFAMLYDVAQTAIGDMVEAVELFNKVNGTDYDGFILDTETVIFNSEQAKNVDNKNPTSNPDIRFSREIPGIEKLRKEHERKRTDSTVLSNAVNALDMSVFNASEKAVLDRFTERLKKIRETEEAIAKYREQGDNISVEDRNRMHNAEARTVKMYSELYESLDKKGVKAVASKATELLIQKYGSIKPGEKPFREVSVPARTNKGNKVSQTVRTAMEAEATSDEMVERLTEEVVKGSFSYIPITDAESKKYADDTIKRKGWNDALLDWTAEVNKNQLGKNNVALGFQLYNNALNAGDTETAVRILTDLAARVREGAQMVQAVRMLKKLSPEYQLYGIQRSIQTLQDSLNERYGDNAPQLEMDSQLVKNYEQAETEEARTAAQEAIYRHVAAQIPHTFMDKWNSWRYLAMLFNPRTHVRNILGNAMFAPVRGAKDATAALIEKLIPQEQRTKAIASGSKLYKAAFEDYKVVADQITGAGKYNDAIGEIERMKPAFGSSKIAKPFNWLANANSFALEAEDMWFSRPAYASALAGYLKARGIADMSTMQQSELDKARAYAIKEAQKATYRDFNDFSNFISAIGRKSKAKNKVVAAAQTIAEGVLPFRRTPANILVRGIEYSPVGLAKGIVQATRGVKKGTATAAEAIDSLASGLVGSALLGLGIFLVKQGVLSAGEDKDKKQQEFDELMGGQNYALNIGGINFTIDWLAPEALPLFVGAEIANVLIENDGEFNLAAVLEGVSRISEPMLEMSMLSSLQDVIENVSYSDGKLMGILVNAFTSYLSQGLPTIFGQIERVTETERETTWVDRNKTQVERDLQYLLGKSLNKLPGEYQQIPYIDAWGRRESTGTVLARIFNNMLNPAYVSEDVSTPTDNELQRLYDLGFDEVFPSGVSQSDKIDGEYLSADEYVKYAETRGQRQRELIEDITSADWYDKLNDTEKSEVIKKAYDYAAETAKRDVKETHEVPKWAQEVEKTSDKADSIKNYALNLASEEMSSTSISKYYEEIEPTGIEFDVYKDYYVRMKEAKGTDADGDGKTDSGSKKKAVMDIINSLNISRDQKDALYLLSYKESTIDEAQWH